jgi:hypothetical protein
VEIIFHHILIQIGHPWFAKGDGGMDHPHPFGSIQINDLLKIFILCLLTAMFDYILKYLFCGSHCDVFH